MTDQRVDLTFKANLRQGRHGWLRLTPAYSVKLVHDLLARYPNLGCVLDPFSGTGTTGLTCAENGINADLFDINPFLVWFAMVKTSRYTDTDVETARKAAQEIVNRLSASPLQTRWQPPMFNIERWWAQDRLLLLSNILHELHKLLPDDSASKNLLLVSFCKLVISWSNAAFNHQSMSFKAPPQPMLFELTTERPDLLHEFLVTVRQLCASVEGELRGDVRVYHQDARTINAGFKERYDAVITSPPYPNRMSYVRELRPYLYWLEYIHEAREAGELDWQAIGGTWGIATSRLNDWQPSDTPVEFTGFAVMIEDIRRHSPLLANYVHKYFTDIAQHLAALRPVLKPGARLFYIVGNSKFYDTLVPVEQVYAALFQQYGYIDIHIEVLRKRNSKKELFEYLVTARNP